MNTLDPQAHALLDLLVSRLEEVIPGEPQTYIGYKEAHDALHLEYLGPTYGESLKKQGLLALANWILTEQKPAITGIVIDQTTHMPAKGYFSPYGKSEDDFQWWTDQVRLSKTFDWRADLHTTEAQGRNELSEPGETVDWNHREVEYIVADYFEMFLKELKGERYSKADHRRRLLLRLHSRSEAAVEFKHRNISAVLAKAGLPYIDGYKPAKNYQNILEQIVEEHIEREPQFFPTLLQSAASENIVNTYLITEPFEAYLEEAPSHSATAKATSEHRVYGGRRLDYARMEAANRHLGKLGEEFVVTLERQRLIEADRPDLAVLVNWVSESVGDGLGYDIASFETDGSQRYIEVKTTRYGKEAPFFLTANELRFSQDHSDKCYLYRVFNFGRSRKIFILQGSLSELCTLDPQLYLANSKGARLLRRTPVILGPQE